jgi:hypothetical protein
MPTRSRSNPARWRVLLLATVACAPHSVSPEPDGWQPIVEFEAGAPSYRWSGDAYVVTLAPVESPTAIVWGVASAARPMAAPLRHGEVPHGTTSLATLPDTIRPGVTYRLSITLTDGRTGHRDFTLP